MGGSSRWCGLLGGWVGGGGRGGGGAGGSVKTLMCCSSPGCVQGSWRTHPSVHPSTHPACCRTAPRRCHRWACPMGTWSSCSTTLSGRWAAGRGDSGDAGRGDLVVSRSVVSSGGRSDLAAAVRSAQTPTFTSHSSATPSIISTHSHHDSLITNHHRMRTPTLNSRWSRSISDPISKSVSSGPTYPSTTSPPSSGASSGRCGGGPRRALGAHWGRAEACTLRILWSHFSKPFSHSLESHTPLRLSNINAITRTHSSRHCDCTAHALDR